MNIKGAALVLLKQAEAREYAFEVGLGADKVLLDGRMGRLHRRSGDVAHVRHLVDPSSHQLFLPRAKPGLDHVFHSLLGVPAWRLELG
jgi:hypothetical protein